MQKESKNKLEPFDDEWLTRALRARSTEARPGLEERILARLAREHESRSQRRWRWMPALAVAFGFLLIVLVGREFLRLRPHPRDERGKIVYPQAVRPSTPVHEPPKIQANKTQSAATTQLSRVATRNTAGRALARTNTFPKLDKFPAETPATDQERLMAEIQRRQATATLVQYAHDFREARDLAIENNPIPPLSPETADEKPNR